MLALLLHRTFRHRCRQDSGIPANENLLGRKAIESAFIVIAEAAHHVESVEPAKREEFLGVEAPHVHAFRPEKILAAQIKEIKMENLRRRPVLAHCFNANASTIGHHNFLVKIPFARRTRELRRIRVEYIEDQLSAWLQSSPG